MAESGVRRLVIRAPNWLGDAVMALPAMEAVRQAFGDAHIAVAAIPSIAPLFAEETSAGPDSVIALPILPPKCRRFARAASTRSCSCPTRFDRHGRPAERRFRSDGATRRGFGDGS